MTLRDQIMQAIKLADGTGHKGFVDATETILRIIKASANSGALASMEEIANLRGENKRLKNRIADLEGLERALEAQRKRWREDPLLQRLDQFRFQVAGMRPGDAEAIATAQARFLDTEHRLQAANQEVERLRAALFNIGWRKVGGGIVPNQGRFAYDARLALAPVGGDHGPTKDVE